MKRAIPIVTASIVFLASFAAVAHAAALMTPENGTLLDLANPIYDAFMHGQHILAGSLALVFAVALARRYGTDRYPWISSDAGSAVLVVLGAFGGALSVTLAGGQEPTVAMFENAGKIAIGAAGGYTLIKHAIVVPYLNKLADKGPKWVHAPAELLLWVFQFTTSNQTAANLAAVTTQPTPPVGAPTTTQVTLTVTTPAGVDPNSVSVPRTITLK